MSTTTALATIRSVLSAKRDWGAPLAGRDIQRLARGHDEYIRRYQADALRAMRDVYVEPLRAVKKALRDKDVPDPGPSYVAAIQLGELEEVRRPLPPLRDVPCTSVAIPWWQTDTPVTTTSGRSGLATLARSSRSAGTIQVAAACGKFPPYAGMSNVPGAQVCAGLGEYNQAHATLTTSFFLPDHDIATLNVTVQLEVDDLSSSGFPFPSDNVLTFAGNRDLGVNGGAAAWIDALMTVYTPSARVTAGRKMVAGWSAYNEYQGHLEAPTGRTVTLTRSVAVAPSTSLILLAIDVEATAFAQGFAADPGQAWARVQIDESATVTDIADGYSGFPSHIRARNTYASLCPEFL
jgi:hypothetical protein